MYSVSINMYAGKFVDISFNGLKTCSNQLIARLNLHTKYTAICISWSHTSRQFCTKTYLVCICKSCCIDSKAYQDIFWCRNSKLPCTPPPSHPNTHTHTHTCGTSKNACRKWQWWFTDKTRIMKYLALPLCDSAACSVKNLTDWNT